jgi:hypothetical protein
MEQKEDVKKSSQSKHRKLKIGIAAGTPSATRLYEVT